MATFLVTGAAGFVGTHFINYICGSVPNATVIATDISSSPDQANWSNLEFKQGDLADANFSDALIEQYKPDFVTHLASFSSVAASWKYPRDSFTNNTTVFLTLAESVRKISRVSRILSVGSSEQYGRVLESDLPIVESTPQHPASPYAIARVAQEALSTLYAERWGVDICMTRSFNHIGPGQSPAFVSSGFTKAFAEALLAKKTQFSLPTGNLDVIRDFVDVRDVVRAYRLILDNAQQGSVFNVCSGIGISIRQLLDELTAITGVVALPKVDNRFIRPVDSPCIVGSRDCINKALGWAPEISLRQSLEANLEYWIQQLGC